MSIRWLRDIVINGEKGTVEIQVGDKRIGDKCYTRINDEVEAWFDNYRDTRGEIIAQGIDILKNRLAGKSVTYPNGQAYDWQ